MRIKAPQCDIAEKKSRKEDLKRREVLQKNLVEMNVAPQTTAQNNLKKCPFESLNSITFSKKYWINYRLSRKTKSESWIKEITDVISR